MTPKEHAKKLIDECKERYTKTDSCFASTAEQLSACNIHCTGHGCPVWDVYAKETALWAVRQINRLAGLPQFQIIYWREVEKEIKDYDINN